MIFHLWSTDSCILRRDTMNERKNECMYMYVQQTKYYNNITQPQYHLIWMNVWMKYKKMLRYAAENDEDEDVHAIHTYIYVSCTTKIVKI